MGNTISITKKVSFEDIQFLIKHKSRNHLLINTLPINEQNCLIRGTVNVSNEEKIVNENIYNSDMYIVIYGKNSNEDNLVQKYSQLERHSKLLAIKRVILGNGILALTRKIIQKKMVMMNLLFILEVAFITQNLLLSISLVKTKDSVRF